MSDKPEPGKPDFEALSAYLDGELPAERVAEVEAWLHASPEARAELERLREMDHLVAAPTGEETRLDPDRFGREMWAEVDRHRERMRGGGIFHPRHAWIPLAAAAALLLMFRNPPPNPVARLTPPRLAAREVALKRAGLSDSAARAGGGATAIPVASGGASAPPGRPVHGTLSAPPSTLPGPPKSAAAGAQGRESMLQTGVTQRETETLEQFLSRLRPAASPSSRRGGQDVASRDAMLRPMTSTAGGGPNAAAPHDQQRPVLDTLALREVAVQQGAATAPAPATTEPSRKPAPAAAARKAGSSTSLGEAASSAAPRADTLALLAGIARRLAVQDPGDAEQALAWLERMAPRSPEAARADFDLTLARGHLPPWESLAQAGSALRAEQSARVIASLEAWDAYILRHPESAWGHAMRAWALGERFRRDGRAADCAAAVAALSAARERSPEPLLARFLDDLRAEPGACR